MDYYEIGQRIRKFRKQNGLSQEQLAEKVDISVTHMSHIETGNTKLSLPVLVAIAEVLSIRVDALLQDRPKEPLLAAEHDAINILRNCTADTATSLVYIMRTIKQEWDKNNLP